MLVNSKVPKVSQKLKEGDVIILTKRPPVEAAATPQEMPLDIVYEDEAIIVINKPAGMVVHPAPGNPQNTLVNALLYHCHDYRESAVFCGWELSIGWIKIPPA